MKQLKVDISPPNLTASRTKYRRWSIALPGTRKYFKSQLAAKRAAGTMAKQVDALAFDLNLCISEIRTIYYELFFYCSADQHRAYFILVNENDRWIQLMYDNYGQRSSYNFVMLFYKCIDACQLSCTEMASYCIHRKLTTTKKRLDSVSNRLKILSDSLQNL